MVSKSLYWFFSTVHKSALRLFHSKGKGFKQNQVRITENLNKISCTETPIFQGEGEEMYRIIKTTKTLHQSQI